MSIIVKVDLCVGCEACVNECPFGAIEMKDDKAVIGDKCTLCGTCVDICPSFAIEMVEEVNSKPAADLSAYKGVWVFAEQRNNKIVPVAFELLGEGRRLADSLGEDLSAVLFGTGMERQCEVVDRGGRGQGIPA